MVDEGGVEPVDRCGEYDRAGTDDALATAAFELLECPLMDLCDIETGVPVDPPSTDESGE